MRCPDVCCKAIGGGGPIRVRRAASSGLSYECSVGRWALAALAMLCWGLAAEARTSYLQSRIFSNLTRDMSFAVLGTEPHHPLPEVGTL